MAMGFQWKDKNIRINYIQELAMTSISRGRLGSLLKSSLCWFIQFKALAGYLKVFDRLILLMFCIKLLTVCSFD